MAAPRDSRTQRRARMARTTLQYSHDYFDHFFRNESYPGIPARRATFSRFPIPRWANSTRRPDPAFIASRPLGPQYRDRRGEEFFYDLRTDDGAGRVVDASVRARLEASGVVVGRILGAGSQGLCAQVMVGGRELVIKYAGDVQTMVVEMWAMREMVGARHIVQVSRVVLSFLLVVKELCVNSLRSTDCGVSFPKSGVGYQV